MVEWWLNAIVITVIMVIIMVIVFMMVIYIIYNPYSHLFHSPHYPDADFLLSHSGWWFGTFVIFHDIWDVILPIDFHIFQRGWNHQPALVYYIGHDILYIITPIYTIYNPYIYYNPYNDAGFLLVISNWLEGWGIRFRQAHIPIFSTFTGDGAKPGAGDGCPPKKDVALTYLMT